MIPSIHKKKGQIVDVIERYPDKADDCHCSNCVANRLNYKERRDSV